MIKRIIACTLCMVLCLTLISFADNNAPVAEQPIEGQTPPEITMPDRGNMPDFAPPDMGNMPDFAPPGRGNIPQFNAGDNNISGNTETPANNESIQVNPSEEVPSQNSGDGQPLDGNMENGRGGGPFGGFPGGMQQQQTEPEQPKTFKELVMEYITPIISVVLLALAFVFVIFYKRKNY